MPIPRYALTLFASLFLSVLLVPVAHCQIYPDVPQIKRSTDVLYSRSPALESVREDQLPSSPAAKTTRKDPENALYYSVVHTVVPIGFGGMLLVVGGSAAPVGALGIMYGILAGPSAGNFYAEDIGMGLFGIGLRLLGIGMMAEATESFHYTSYSHHRHKPGLARGGFLLYMGSTLWNIVTAPGSARTYNARHGIGYRLLPIIDPESRTTGLALCLSFDKCRNSDESGAFERSTR
jgi:hypothetical protein